MAVSRATAPARPAILVVETATATRSAAIHYIPLLPRANVSRGARIAVGMSDIQGGNPLELSDPYRQLVHGVQDYAIVLLDRSGHIVSWNRGAERLKGYAAPEIIGRHFSVLYAAEA